MSDATLAELHRWLVRVEAKLDAGLDKVTRQVEAVTGDHEQRLRRVERVLYAASGLAATGSLTGIGSLIAQNVGGA
jgi:hypothetical protein